MQEQIEQDLGEFSGLVQELDTERMEQQIYAHLGFDTSFQDANPAPRWSRHAWIPVAAMLALGIGVGSFIDLDFGATPGNAFEQESELSFQEVWMLEDDILFDNYDES